MSYSGNNYPNLGSPHRNVASPQQNVGSPHQSVGSPQQNLGSPHQNLSSPHQNVGSPHQILGSPQTAQIIVTQGATPIQYILPQTASQFVISQTQAPFGQMQVPFGTSQPVYEPCLNIIENPQSKFRFRYQSEMSGTHGCIMGENSDKMRKSFPQVKLENYVGGKVKIRCSLSTLDETSPKPHVHRLLMKHTNGDEASDVVEMTVSHQDHYTATFQGLGIIHTGRRQVKEVLEIRKKKLLREEQKMQNLIAVAELTQAQKQRIREEADTESRLIDLNCIRLCFEAFVEGPQKNTQQRICQPVYSTPIYNLKCAQTGDLKIVRVDKYTSSCVGNEEVYIFVEKVNKKNIKVRFYELDDEDNMIWCDYARFSELDVHHQYAIAFRTPAYKDTNIEQDVNVFLDLFRPTDGANSEAIAFKYKPQDTIRRKRPRSGASDMFLGIGGNTKTEPARTPTPLQPVSNSFFLQNSPVRVSTTGTSSSSTGFSGVQTTMPDIQQPAVLFSPTENVLSHNNMAVTLNIPEQVGIETGENVPCWDYDTALTGSTSQSNAPGLARGGDAVEMPQQPGMNITHEGPAPPDSEVNTYFENLLQLPEYLNLLDQAHSSLEGLDLLELSQLGDGNLVTDAAGDGGEGQQAGKEEELDTESREARVISRGVSSEQELANEFNSLSLNSRTRMRKEADDRLLAVQVSMRIAEALQKYAATNNLEPLFERVHHLLAVKTVDGDNTLHTATIHHQKEVLEFILKVALKMRDFNMINSVNLDEQTPLHLAVITKQRHMAQLLLTHGADPDITNMDGNTAVHLAIQNQDKGCLAVLLDRSNYTITKKLPNLDVTNYDGYTPLHMSVLSQNLQMVHMLCETGCDVNKSDQTSGRTALHFTVERKNLDITNYLLTQHHINVNSQTFRGDTALHLAAAAHNENLCIALMEAQADPHIENFILNQGDDESDSEGEEERIGVKEEEVRGKHCYSAFDLAKDNKLILEILSQKYPEVPSRSHQLSSSSLTNPAVTQVSPVPQVTTQKTAEVAPAASPQYTSQMAACSVKSKAGDTGVMDSGFLSGEVPSERDLDPLCTSGLQPSGKVLPLLDHKTVEKLARVMDTQSQWKTVADMLDLRDHIRMWESKKSPTVCLFNLVEEQNIPLNQICYILEALEFHEAYHILHDAVEGTP